jgi:hypothetical protein
MEDIDTIGESPDKEDIHRCLVHRDIRDLADKVFTPFEIANCENLDEEEGATVRPAVITSERREAPLREISISIAMSQDLRNRKFYGKVFYNI